jgi:hypothetical protein
MLALAHVAARGPHKTAQVDGTQFPFPACHSSVDEYIEPVEAAGGEVVVAVDVPMQQRGPLPGPFVLLARKLPACEQGTEQPGSETLPSRF